VSAVVVNCRVDGRTDVVLHDTVLRTELIRASHEPCLTTRESDAYGATTTVVTWNERGRSAIRVALVEQSSRGTLSLVLSSIAGILLYRCVSIPLRPWKLGQEIDFRPQS